MLNSAFRLLLVAWAGSLWSTVWVALTIFYAQPDRHLAGMLAARLFSIETYLGLAVLVIDAARGQRARFSGCHVAVALLLINEWVLKRFMDEALANGTALGLRFGPWHGISALLYMAACVAVAIHISRNVKTVGSSYPG